MLPERFLERMRGILGEEYGDFLECCEREHARGLRLNPGKVGRDGRSAVGRFGLRAACRDAGFACLSPVPWAEDGYYYEATDQPGKHPFHEAGVYYIQEPSAMAPVELLGVKPGERVLDLCAAPGGKSTQIAAKLCGSGFLVCNEIHPARAKILSENIERMGIGNACVTNETPERLADFFPEYFDCILVDAPCSGEGMFRRNEEACEEWSPENVRLCAQRQDGILDCAARMLRPGGRLVYSTCTFAPEEDEGSVCRFLRRQTGFRILPVDKEAMGLAGCDGMPDALAEPGGGPGGDLRGGSEGGPKGGSGDGLRGDSEGGLEGGSGGGLRGDSKGGLEGDLERGPGDGLRGGPEEAAKASEEAGRGLEDVDRDSGELAHDLRQTLRLWPHRIRGEGHFAAVLKKDGDMPDGYRNIEINKMKNRTNAKNAISEEFLRFCTENLNFSPVLPRSVEKGETMAAVSARALNRPEMAKAEGQTGKARKAKKAASDAAIGKCRAGKDKGRSGQGTEESDGEWLLTGLGRAVGMEGNLRYVQFGGNLYMAPADMPSLDGLKVLRPGLHLGEVKKNRFEPSHALALALHPACAAHVRNLDSGDPAVGAYLNGLTLPGEGEKGWYLICVDGFGLGWGKLAGNVMKNHYPRGLRK